MTTSKAKHTGSGKTLIIEDDEPQEESDEMNPFSFKQFIHSKNQPTSSTQDTNEKKRNQKKLLGSTFIVEKGTATPQGYNFNLDVQEPFFSDPTMHSPSVQEEDEDEEEGDWSGSYQPSAIEEAHKFGLSSGLVNTTYQPQSSPSTESNEEASLDPWCLDSSYTDDTKQQARKASDDHEKEHEAYVKEVLFQTLQHNHEKVKEENAQLRKQIKELQKISKAQKQKATYLVDELQKRTIKEEKEAQALESMVQSVEQNLELMTKRAVKAENNVVKLKQEILQLQSQFEICRAENEQLRAGETASLNTMKHNAHVASECLSKAASSAEASIKQLMSGAETLCMVSQLLKSIDKISEIPSEDR
ncbi:endosome-associated-trafficking regulator 1-like [Acipenser ruthenus]|uniref:endosome-associated-trafficking regulator 1-like n=1 Tax=Acipenser ruthenus TaxID=7906 RepID=UPI00145B76CF|nr:endosome-associated-trafficking regulator 1-like [Acipenser ruthenus]